jgi:hypothetical protein
MTKQEVIKNAYGEHWERVQNHHQYDGWIYSWVLFTIDIDWQEIKVDGKLMKRPKSLQGIENNNDWIKIESEADLPSDLYCDYLCLTSKRKIIIAYYSFKEGIFKRYATKHPIFGITHYQPINKPLKPLY